MLHSELYAPSCTPFSLHPARLGYSMRPPGPCPFLEPFAPNLLLKVLRQVIYSTHHSMHSPILIQDTFISYMPPCVIKTLRAVLKMRAKKRDELLASVAEQRFWGQRRQRGTTIETLRVVVLCTLFFGIWKKGTGP